MKDNHRDESDNILDRALAAYSTQEPLSGLEERVLSRVLAASPTPRFGLPRWVFAVGVAAGVLLFAIALRVHLNSTSQPRATRPGTYSQAATREVGQALSPASSAAAQVVHSEARTHMASALPKLQEFPAPAPLTPGERALLAFVSQAPDEAQKVALEQAQADVPPIQIETIQIEPLHIDGLTEEQ
jgi:hypothetical protein